MSKKRIMYAFMICFSVGSILLLIDGFNYIKESSITNIDFCGCENEELKPYICSMRFEPFSSFAIANYFYFFGIISLMLYCDIPSLTEIYIVLKNKYLLKNK